jgi:hypothetical protein
VIGEVWVVAEWIYGNRRPALLMPVAAECDTPSYPWRGWRVLTDDGSVLGFVSEGFAGNDALMVIPELATLPEMPRVEVTLRQFREMRADRYEPA